jgi:hypothetical protein
VVNQADLERVDFVAIDRSLGIHDGVIKSCRASVILLPPPTDFLGTAAK